MPRRTMIAAVPAVPAVAAAVALAAVSAGGGAAAAAPAAAPGAVSASIVAIDRGARTATYPLHEGRTAGGAPTFYVVTESSDEADAKARGVIYAPKLRNALGSRAVQTVSRAGDVVTFPGTVDFAPKLSVTPNKKTGFPPTAFKPGAVGDDAYSPLITTGNGIVLNAPQIANDSGQADTVVKLDKAAGRATLTAFGGYVNGRFNLYIRTDGSDPLLAALESTTYAKNLAAAPGAGSNAASSSRSAISPIVNGPRGRRNPRRQGLQSALLGEGQPLNVEQAPAGSPAYSPLWDVSPVVWTTKAIRRHKVIRLTSAAQIAARVRNGYLTSLGKDRRNASLGGLRAIGFVSNCSIVAIY